MRSLIGFFSRAAFCLLVASSGIQPARAQDNDADFAITCHVQHAKNKYPPYREFGSADIVQFNIYPDQKSYWRVGEYDDSNAAKITPLDEISASKIVIQYDVTENRDGGRRATEETVDRVAGTYVYASEKGCWNGREGRSDWCRIVYKMGRCEKADRLFEPAPPATKF